MAGRQAGGRDSVGRPLKGGNGQLLDVACGAETLDEARLRPGDAGFGEIAAQLAPDGRVTAIGRTPARRNISAVSGRRMLARRRSRSYPSKPPSST